MQPVMVPAIKIVAGQLFAVTWIFRDADGDMDLTEWSGRFAISERPFDPPFWSGDLSLTENGEISVEIPQSDTACFSSFPRLGGVANAIYQIDLTAPLPEFDQLWQGPVVIAGRVPA